MLTTPHCGSLLPSPVGLNALRNNYLKMEKEGKASNKILEIKIIPNDQRAVCSTRNVANMRISLNTVGKNTK